MRVCGCDTCVLTILDLVTGLDLVSMTYDVSVIIFGTWTIVS